MRECTLLWPVERLHILQPALLPWLDLNLTRYGLTSGPALHLALGQVHACSAVVDGCRELEARLTRVVGSRGVGGLERGLND